MVFDPDFLHDDSEQHPNQLLNDRFGDNPNQLLKYLQHQSPEVLARVAQSVSPRTSRNDAARAFSCPDYNRSGQSSRATSLGNDDGLFSSPNGTENAIGTFI
jgi:hypothetical protein